MASTSVAFVGGRDKQVLLANERLPRVVRPFMRMTSLHLSIPPNPSRHQAKQAPPRVTAFQTAQVPRVGTDSDSFWPSHRYVMLVKD